LNIGLLIILSQSYKEYSNIILPFSDNFGGRWWRREIETGSGRVVEGVVARLRRDGRGVKQKGPKMLDPSGFF